MTNKKGIVQIKKEEQIYQEIRNLALQGKNTTIQYVNYGILQTYWTIGKKIHDETPNNSYGKNLIKKIADRLTEEFGSGFRYSNLQNMRQFYEKYKNFYAVRRNLIWTHYRLLIRVKDKETRTFYENETIENRWSSRQLERQIKSHYYERIVSNQTQKQLVHNRQDSIDYTPIIKDPYILDFLSLPNNYQEKDLEEALRNKLNTFLTELGRGYSFIGRQVPIVIDGSRYYIDLVFHNNLLNCDVLFELKVRPLKPTDLGQLQMYLNYYKKNLVVNGDNPPVGILLCEDKNDLVVEYSLPEDNESIYVSKYLDYLPSKEEFKKILNNRVLKD